MLQSNFRMYEWLEAIAREFTPWGDQVKVRRVSHTDEVCVSGKGEMQSTGKREPFFVQTMQCDRTHRYRMYSSNILHDEVNGVVHVCADDQEIKDAQTQVEKERRADAAKADLEDLKSFLIKCWQHRDSIFWQCLNEFPSVVPNETFVPSQEAVDSIRLTVESGLYCEGWLARMSAELADALRQVLYIESTEERLAVFNKMWSDYKDLRVEKMKGFKLTADEANYLLRRFKSGMAMRILVWTRKAHRAVNNPRALFAVLSKANNNGNGRDWMSNQLTKLSVPLPRAKADGAYMCMITGAREVLKCDGWKPADLRTRKSSGKPQDHQSVEARKTVAA